MTLPLISVVMPVSRDIDVTLESLSRILSQPNVNLEIILVYVKPGLEVKQRLLTLFPNAVIKETYHLVMGNPHTTRCRGMPLATGEFIHLMDDDDLLPEDWYSQLNYNVDINWSMVSIVKVDGKLSTLRAPACYAKSNVSGTVYRASVISKVFDAIPADMPSFISPYMYMMVAYHLCSPEYHVLDEGIIRVRCAEWYPWKDITIRNKQPRHTQFWKGFLDMGIPTTGIFHLDNYFKHYGKGVGPWRNL